MLDMETEKPRTDVRSADKPTPLASALLQPTIDASRAPRPTATQHMIFEDEKCLGAPRTSQMPASGSRQCFSVLDLLAEDRPEVPVQVVGDLGVQVDGVE